MLEHKLQSHLNYLVVDYLEHKEVNKKKNNQQKLQLLLVVQVNLQLQTNKMIYLLLVVFLKHKLQFHLNHQGVYLEHKQVNRKKNQQQKLHLFLVVLVKLLLLTKIIIYLLSVVFLEHKLCPNLKNKKLMLLLAEINLIKQNHYNLVKQHLYNQTLLPLQNL